MEGKTKLTFEKAYVDNALLCWAHTSPPSPTWFVQDQGPFSLPFVLSLARDATCLKINSHHSNQWEPSLHSHIIGLFPPLNALNFDKLSSCHLHYTLWHAPDTKPRMRTAEIYLCDAWCCSALQGRPGSGGAAGWLAVAGSSSRPTYTANLINNFPPSRFSLPPTPL